MQNTIIFIIICFIILLLFKSLIKTFICDFRILLLFLSKILIKPKYSNRSDFNKAYKYLLNRNTISEVEQTEERFFFLNLINEATNIKQLKTFTKQIKKFYKKKIKSISVQKFKNRHQIYFQHYKEIVIFLILAIKNRYTVINYFDTLNDYQAFAELLLEANESTTIDAIMAFAEKLKYSDYKKLHRLAQQKKVNLNPQQTNNSQFIRRVSLAKLMVNIISSVYRYCLIIYIMFICISLAISLAIPRVVTHSNNNLLLLANNFQAQPLIPHFAKFNTGYYIINQRVYFYKETNFINEQKKYYLTWLTTKLCKIPIFHKACCCSRNRSK